MQSTTPSTAIAPCRRRSKKALRVAMLAEWKKYRVFLGRVTGQPIWPSAPAWPEQPEPYNGETTIARV